MSAIYYKGYGFMYNPELKHYELYAMREHEDEKIAMFSELQDVYNYVDLIMAGLVSETWYKNVDKLVKQ